MENPSSLPNGDPGLQLTQNAIEHFERILKNKEQYVGIRVSVKKAGCSGYEYVLTLAKEIDLNEMDYIFQHEHFNIIVDKEIYLKFMKGGTTLDFQKEGINEGVKFDNPNVGHQCGCGESFTLANEV